VPRALEETSRFKRDKKRCKGSGRHDWDRMRAVVQELMHDRPLDPRHRDHELSGEYAGVRECCRVPDDWLLQNRRAPLLGREVLKAVMAAFKSGSQAT